MNGVWNFNKRSKNEDWQANSGTFRALNCKAAQAHTETNGPVSLEGKIFLIKSSASR
jgi:hypothetical protein